MAAETPTDPRRQAPTIVEVCSNLRHACNGLIAASLTAAERRLQPGAQGVACSEGGGRGASRGGGSRWMSERLTGAYRLALQSIRGRCDRAPSTFSGRTLRLQPRLLQLRDGKPGQLPRLPACGGGRTRRHFRPHRLLCRQAPRKGSSLSHHRLLSSLSGATFVQMGTLERRRS